MKMNSKELDEFLNSFTPFQKQLKGQKAVTEVQKTLAYSERRKRKFKRLGL